MALPGEWNVPFHDEDFDFIVSLIRKRTGIDLGPRKRDMVYARLSRRVRALGLPSFSAYCQALQGPQAEQETAAAVNALTTNLTRFFREPHHFDHLVQHVLSRAGQAPRQPDGRRRLRLWSAGCSTGEEPYSMAMAITAALDKTRATRGAATTQGWDIRILATDIDTDVLQRAARGIYSRDDILRIPAHLRDNSFEAWEDGRVIICDRIRQMVDFKPLNLVGDWPMRQPFDGIFCRNVAIYFPRPVQRHLFERMGGLLQPGGMLYIGHSENLFGLSACFHLVARTVYQKNAGT